MLTNFSRQILKLKMVPGIGNATIVNLYNNLPQLFESEIHPKDIREFIKPKQYKSFEEIFDKLDSKFENLLKILEKENINIANIADQNYPSSLKQIPDCPILIFYKGNIDFNYEKSIAIVGTRKVTTYGQKQCERFASFLGLKGFTIISGLAAGIDSIAHIEGLNNGAKCIGVIGCGHQHIFPKSNWRLYEKVIDNGGCIISEFFPYEEPRAEFFPMRNRIIAGLAKSTLVIEAARKSGSIITANLAFDYNREVFAIPADLIRPNSQGCNELIQKDIAKLVFRPEDICEGILNYRISNDLEEKKYDFSNLPIPQKQIMEFIFQEPRSTDSILENLDIDISELNLILTDLELEGMIIKSGDGKWGAG